MSTSNLVKYGRQTPAASQPTSSPTSTGPIHSAGPMHSSGPVQATGTHSMSTQLPAPPMLAKKDEALEKAIQKYLEELSDDDKKAFMSAPDVIERLQEMEGNGKAIIPSSLTTRVEKVLQCVKHFMGSLGIFIQHSPEISSLVVGGINCILTLVLGYIEFFERLTLMMESIGTHLSYLSEYSRPNFQESKKLQQALGAAYCDLLDFYVKARRVFINKKGKSSYAQGFKLFFRLIWEPFEAQFGSIEARFSNHTIAVVRLANVDYQNRALEYQNQALEYQNKNLEYQNRVLELLEYNKRQDEIRKLEEDKKSKEEAYEMRRNILKWLSPGDFEETHQRHFKKRFGNTGQWLLDDPRFRNWRDEKQSSLLWCYGAPGSGKTVLASLVIEHLSTLYQLSTDTGITFVYCNYKESRTTITYMRLALKQLCRTMQSLPLEIQEVHKQHYRNDSQPSYDELKNVFLAIIQQFGRIFLVLDALDECTLDQRKDLCDFILTIANPTVTTPTSTSQGIVKLFVTSRKESDIEQAFQQKSIPTIEVEATKVNSDIEVYVKAQIELRLQNHSLRLRNIALKNKILSVLTKKAGGMFLWVEFQLDAICAEPSDNGIEKALERVPDDMDATYERILKTINDKPRPKRELARRTLIWTTYAQRPLPINDLAYAISIEIDTESLEDLESSIPTEEFILDACANLISVDQSKKRYVRFVHFSVQEFLISQRSTTLGMEPALSHREIAQTCMIFLTISDTFCHNSIRKPTTIIGKKADKSPAKELHQYAFEKWPHHLSRAKLDCLLVDDNLVTLTFLFINKGPVVLTEQPVRILNFSSPTMIKTFLKFSPPLLALIFDLPGTERCKKLCGKQSKPPQIICDYGEVLPDDNLAMHYATAELDSVPVAQRLFDHGYALNYSYPAPHSTNNELPDWLQLSPLYLVQSTKMATFLLDNGNTSELQDLRGTIDPLSYFVQKENQGMEVFKLLLDRVVDHDNTRYNRALQDAVLDGKIGVIRLLVEKGANVNAQCGRDQHINALQAAAFYGKVEVIRLLLDMGAHVNALGGSYGTALQVAAFRGRIEAARLLLDNGAEVNSQSGYFGNALQAAALNGNIEIVQLLLDYGAQVNAQGGKYGNALQVAIYRGKVDIIRLLLDNGADVNAQGGVYGNALQAAAYDGKLVVIQWLLDMGADVNIQGGDYGNALHAAAYKNREEVIRLLLDKGANVNAKGGKCGNVLQAAAMVCGIDVVRLLLDHGADINAQDGEHGNALQVAVNDGNIEVVRLLLDRGADINAQGGEYGTTLQAAAASFESSVEVIQLLLDKGADINAQGGEHGTALNAAAWAGHVEVVQLLVDHGADINAQGGEHGTALQAAARMGNVEVIQLLLDHGAGINARSQQCSNALQDAVSRGKIEVIQLLLDKGADANAQDREYGNALHTAAHDGKVEIVRLLLNTGADVNILGGMFGTALQAAVYNGHIEVIQLLLDKGADVNIQGGMFGTVLQAAAYNGRIEVIQLLLDQGADPNARGGKYGAALKKMLALESTGVGQKIPADISLLVELLQDHAPMFREQSPKQEYEVEAMRYLNEDRCSLDVFREILKSRGWKREPQGKEDEPGNKDASEGEIENGNDDTPQELGLNLLENPNKSSQKTTAHVWRLFGLAFLIFLIYTFVEF